MRNSRALLQPSNWFVLTATEFYRHRVLQSSTEFYRVLAKFSGSTEFSEASDSTELSGIEFVGSTES